MKFLISIFIIMAIITFFILSLASITTDIITNNPKCLLSSDPVLCIEVTKRK